jgi:hypothetical protein
MIQHDDFIGVLIVESRAQSQTQCALHEVIDAADFLFGLVST